MSKEIEIWNKVLSAAIQLSGVKVNRDSFLQEKLSIYCTGSQMSLAIEKGTIGNVDEKILDEIAKECIKSHTLQVTTLSTALGMPGGFAILGSIPGDLAQYYYHVFVLSQKLAYIYGYPDLCDENGAFTESAKNLLTTFVGVMGGVAAANKVIQEIAEQAQKQVFKRLPRYALTKGILYPLVKQVAKWIGVSLTKQSFAKGVSKFVPILGGVVSGGLTYYTFKPQAKKLMGKLKTTMYLAYENKKKEEFDSAEEFENVNS